MLLEKQPSRVRDRSDQEEEWRHASWHFVLHVEDVSGQKQEIHAGRENRVMVAPLPQLAWRYVSRVAERNPGNAEHGSLHHSTEQQRRRRRSGWREIKQREPKEEQTNRRLSRGTSERKTSPSAHNKLYLLT